MQPLVDGLRDHITATESLPTDGDTHRTADQIREAIATDQDWDFDGEWIEAESMTALGYHVTDIE